VGAGDGGKGGVGVDGYLVLTIKIRVTATSFHPQIGVSRGTRGPELLKSLSVCSYVWSVMKIYGLDIDN
jgi:hypothetical protein